MQQQEKVQFPSGQEVTKDGRKLKTKDLINNFHLNFCFLSSTS